MDEHDDLADEDGAVMYADDDPGHDRDLGLVERHVRDAIAETEDLTGRTVTRVEVLEAVFLGMGWSQAAAYDAVNDPYEAAEAILLESARDREEAMGWIDDAVLEIQAELGAVPMHM